MIVIGAAAIEGGCGPPGIVQCGCRAAAGHGESGAEID